MSSGSSTTGDKGENPGSDDKPSLDSSHPSAGLQQSHGHILAQPTPTFQHAELMKPTMQKSVRPIAPAPTGIGKPGSISHNPPLGMSTGLLAQTFRGTNKVPGDTGNVSNMGTNLVMGAHAVPVSLAQGGIVQMNPASLVSTQNVTPTVISTPMNIIRGPHPTFPSHLPRGAVAASALSVGKTGPTIAAGSALIRPTQSTVQIPISSNQGMPAALLQSRPLLSNIKPVTSPIVRPTSPVIGIPMPAKHGEHNRPTYPYHGSVTPSTNSAIQITLRNANTNSDTISKPILTHTGHTLSKQVQLAQTQPVTQSKIIVSQTTSNTMIPTSTVNIPKTAKIAAQRPTMGQVVLPTSAVAEVSRSDAAQHQHQMPHSTYNFLNRGFPSTTTAISSPNSAVHPTDTRHDNRTNLSNIQVPSYIQQPTPESVYNIYNPNYAVMYQPRSNLNLLVTRPQVDQTGRVSVSNPVPNLSATLQAHQMTMAPNTGVRFNQIMLDPTARHPTISVPSYSTTSVSHVDNKGFLGSPLTETNISSLASVATVASNIYSNTNQHQQHLQNHHPQQQQQQQQQSNPSASPRPTILRKRTSDNIGASSVKKQLALMSERQSPRPEPSQPQSNTSSPKTPAGENSQSSTDTALSSNDAATPTQNSVPDVRVKSEHSEVLENGLAVLTSVMQSQAPSNCNSVEASPRKKPRKQLLHANEELKDNSSTEEDEEDEEVENLTEIKKDKFSPKIKEERSEYVDEEGVRWTTDRCKPHISLLNFYNLTWKARNNHFLKASDVKPKEERRATVNELSNQKGIVQKSSGWKLYHMAAQLEDLVDLEKEICQRVTKYQHLFEPKIPTGGKIENDYNKPYEMAQANIQRCQLLVDQLLEAKSSMLKVLEHKPKIQEIVNKHMSKRPIKKKERP